MFVLLGRILYRLFFCLWFVLNGQQMLRKSGSDRFFGDFDRILKMFRTHFMRRRRPTRVSECRLMAFISLQTCAILSMTRNFVGLFMFGLCHNFGLRHQHLCLGVRNLLLSCDGKLVAVKHVARRAVQTDWFQLARQRLRLHLQSLPGSLVAV